MERDDPHDELVPCSTPDSAAHPYRHTPSSLVLFPRIRAEKLQDDTNLALETTHTDSLLQHRRSRSRSLPDSSTGNSARACRTSCKAGCRSRRQALSPTPAKLDAANPIMRRVVFPSRAGDHGDAEVMGITACTASRSRGRLPQASISTARCCILSVSCCIMDELTSDVSDGGGVLAPALRSTKHVPTHASQANSTSSAPRSWPRERRMHPQPS